MGKLAHIKQGMNSQSMLDGVVQAVGEYVAQVVASKLSEDMSRGGDGLNQIKGAVSAIEPAIRAAVSAAVGHLVQELAASQDAVKAELKASAQKLTGTQQALMQSLARVKIPDHSAALTRIEQCIDRKTVDLSPLEKQIEAVLLKMDMDEEKEPERWVFHVKRNKAGLIESVTAEEE